MMYHIGADADTLRAGGGRGGGRGGGAEKKRERLSFGERREFKGGEGIRFG